MVYSLADVRKMQEETPSIESMYHAITDGLDSFLENIQISDTVKSLEFLIPKTAQELVGVESKYIFQVFAFMHKLNGGARKQNKKTMDVYHDILQAFHSIDFEEISVRGLYYRVVSLFNYPKTERTYELIQRSAYDMRRKGILDFDLIVDGTRFRSKSKSYGTMEDFAIEQSKIYRKSLWEESDYYVEVAVEKDAMKSILYRETSYYDVNLISTKGFSSLTFWYTTAEKFKEVIEYGKIPVFLMMTDFDEAGRDMRKSAVATLKDVFGLEEGYDYIMKELAVTEEQIKDYALPQRPEKSEKSTHDFAVEIDAFKPSDIRRILELEILEYIDADKIARIKEIEKLERESIPEFFKSKS